MLSYTTFFLGSTGVAGALTGLQIVSLSIAPERLTGKHASVEQQAVAATAFTALVDALWISLFALGPGKQHPHRQPGVRADWPDQHGWSHDQVVAGQAAGEAEQPLAVPALGDHWPLRLPDPRRPFTAVSSLVAQSDAATLVFIFFGVGLARAWNCSARAAEACLTCWPPAVAGPGHRALAPGLRARLAPGPKLSRDQCHRPFARRGPVRVTRRMLRREKGYARAPDNGPAGGRTGPHHAGPNPFVRYDRTDGIDHRAAVNTTIVCVVPGRVEFCRCRGRANPGGGPRDRLVLGIRPPGAGPISSARQVARSQLAAGPGPGAVVAQSRTKRGCGLDRRAENSGLLSQNRSSPR